MPDWINWILLAVEIAGCAVVVVCATLSLRSLRRSRQLERDWRDLNARLTKLCDEAQIRATDPVPVYLLRAAGMTDAEIAEMKRDIAARRVMH